VDSSVACDAKQPFVGVRVVDNVARLRPDVWSDSRELLLRAVDTVDLNVEAVEHAPRVE
jgi:hypothetical protein